VRSGFPKGSCPIKKPEARWRFKPDPIALGCDSRRPLCYTHTNLRLREDLQQGRRPPFQAGLQDLGASFPEAMALGAMTSALSRTADEIGLLSSVCPSQPHRKLITVRGPNRIPSGHDRAAMKQMGRACRDPDEPASAPIRDLSAAVKVRLFSSQKDFHRMIFKVGNDRSSSSLPLGRHPGAASANGKKSKASRCANCKSERWSSEPSRNDGLIKYVRERLPAM